MNKLSNHIEEKLNQVLIADCLTENFEDVKLFYNFAYKYNYCKSKSDVIELVKTERVKILNKICKLLNKLKLYDYQSATDYETDREALQSIYNQDDTLSIQNETLIEICILLNSVNLNIIENIESKDKEEIKMLCKKTLKMVKLMSYFEYQSYLYKIDSNAHNIELMLKRRYFRVNLKSKKPDLTSYSFLMSFKNINRLYLLLRNHLIPSSKNPNNFEKVFKQIPINEIAPIELINITAADIVQIFEVLKDKSILKVNSGSYNLRLSKMFYINGEPLKENTIKQNIRRFKDCGLSTQNASLKNSILQHFDIQGF